MYITGTGSPTAWERKEDIPAGEPYFEAAAYPPGEGEIRADQIGKRLYRVQTTPTQKIGERVDALESADKLTQAKIEAASGRQDFLEDCFAEMAMQVYT